MNNIHRIDGHILVNACFCYRCGKPFKEAKVRPILCNQCVIDRIAERKEYWRDYHKKVRRF